MPGWDSVFWQTGGPKNSEKINQLFKAELFLVMETEELANPEPLTGNLSGFGDKPHQKQKPVVY